MCGIAGGFFWGETIDRRAARTAIDAMVDAIGHRGPDGNGTYLSGAEPNREPFVALGHTRLAIIDVSSAGAQPMGGPDGQPWVSFNGEIYNFASLRAELEGRGARFTSHSDTEVILRGYSAWGADVVTRLRGMFAFALWDPSMRRLLIARDRLGIKPLYIHRGDGFLLFASEVRALLASRLIRARINTTAIWQYLGYQAVPAPLTLIDNVEAMEPASWLSVGVDGAVAHKQYWRMLDTAPRDVSATEARTLTAAALRSAVSSHLVSDVPVGAFLSGGIDSSAVVALMHEAGVRPRTFSVGFAERAFDESEHAALVARTFDAEHTHIPLTGDELLQQLPRALRRMDQPTGDGVNTYIVSGAVRERGIKVALSGLGGDELFGGYPSFARLMRIADLSQVWRRSPGAFRQLAAATVRRLGGGSVASQKAAALLETDGDVASTFPVTRQLLSREQRLALLSQEALTAVEHSRDPYARLLADAFDSAPETSVFARISFAESRTYMHDVLLRDTDQMSMAHALEVRVPLLDHELVELVSSMPDSVKRADGSGIPKRLLVESLGSLLPPSIVRRPKQGFTLPFDPWMRGPLRSMCEDRLGPRGLAGRSLFNGAEVTRLWRAFLDGSGEVTWSRLWALVVLESWLDAHNVAA